jgi:hypothetical protein
MRHVIAAGTWSVLSVVACSSGNDGSPATASGFGQSFCNLIEPCCAAAGLGTTGILCNAFVQSAASKGTYDATNGQACIDGVKAESSSGTFCTLLGNDVTACQHVFSKTGAGVQPGGTCSQDSDCAVAAGGTATCFETTSFGDAGTSTTKTCVQLSAGKAGDGPCIGIVDPQFTLYSWNGQGPPPGQAFTCAIADGVTCSDTTHQCVALADPGQACSSSTDCVTTAYCPLGSGTGSTCIARLADGASCAAQSSGCQTTSYCDSTSQTCTPFLAPGAACTVDQQCQHGCVNQACAKGTSNFGLALLCGG